MRQWAQFRTESAAKQFTRNQFNDLLSREQAMIDEPLFSDVITGIPETWRANGGFEQFLTDCPHCLLGSPVWRLAKSNPRLPLMASNTVPVLHPKFQGELVESVKFAVNESATAREAIGLLDKHLAPCPAGRWTPDTLREFCLVNNVTKRVVTFWGK